MISVDIDSVKFELKEAHDFSWLQGFGTLFTVYDQQDSGNICFGVKKDGVKQFIKYAGAKTIAYLGEPQDAVVRLKNAVPNYRELKHPYLVELIESYETLWVIKLTHFKPHNSGFGRPMSYVSILLRALRWMINA